MTWRATYAGPYRGAVLPEAYLDRYVTRPMVKPSSGRGRDDEWPTLLFPHAAAALSRRSQLQRATAAAAALTAGAYSRPLFSST